ncbi:MAG: hypothetical protein WC501_04195 [Candidatus Micrarchaeia archaeon]
MQKTKNTQIKWKKTTKDLSEPLVDHLTQIQINKITFQNKLLNSLSTIRRPDDWSRGNKLTNEQQWARFNVINAIFHETKSPRFKPNLSVAIEILKEPERFDIDLYLAAKNYLASSINCNRLAKNEEWSVIVHALIDYAHNRRKRLVVIDNWGGELRIRLENKIQSD